jgi:hypothetical protein
VAFTFDVATAGWESGHLHTEFFDLIHFAAQGDVLPSRWVAFALPAVIYGPEGPVSVDGLTPASVANMWDARDDLVSGAIGAFRVAGVPGYRMDLSTSRSSVALFGGPDGDFAMDPALAIRAAVVALDDGRLLLVLVLAPGDELGSAWREARPILRSVRMS